MTESSALVLLGFVDQPIKNEVGIDWNTNKIGGKPAFPDSIDDGMLTSLFNDQVTCSDCSNLCSLICQIQCAIDESPTIRVIYIFACLKEGCDYFAVTRLILQSGTKQAMESKHLSLHSGWCDDEEDQRNSQDEKYNGTNKFGIGEDMIYRRKLLPKCFENCIAFRPYYIYVESIDDLKSARLAMIKKEKQRVQDGTLTNEDGEKYENPEVSTIFANDKIAYKFHKHLRNFPKQVIRYSWQGKPLLNRSNVNFRIDDCENCGSTRQFEFQLMPALISQLKLSSPPPSSSSSSSPSSLNLDFGSVLIYTCSNNCDSKTFNPEKCILLEEIDQNIIKRSEFSRK